MAFEDVKSDIIAQAKVEAQKVVAVAEAEAKEIKMKAKEEVDQYKRDAESHNSILFERTRKKMLAEAQFDAQRRILGMKQQVIDDVLNSVRISLISMDAVSRKKFISMLLATAKKEMSVAKVYVNQKDLKLLSGVVVKDSNIGAGIFVENKDGTICVDLTVDTILEQIRDRHLVELSEVLFV